MAQELLFSSHQHRKNDQNEDAVSAEIAMTAGQLGNTKAVYRSSYIYPGLISATETGELIQLAASLPTEAERELTIDETRFIAILPKLDCTKASTKNSERSK